MLLVLNYSNASVSLPQAIAKPDVDFLVLTLGITTGLCIAAFAAAYWLSCLFKIDQADRVSLMYGLGMNNNETGLVLLFLCLARTRESWSQSSFIIWSSTWWPEACMK